MNLSIRNADDIQKESPGKGRLPTLWGAKFFLGDEIYNRREDRLGILREFILDPHGGRICYALMSTSGFLGIGGKLLVIPWRALTRDAKNACFVLDIAEARLMNAPGFDKRHWPDMSDAAWVRDVDAFYGIPPATSCKAGQSMIHRVPPALHGKPPDL